LSYRPLEIVESHALHGGLPPYPLAITQPLHTGISRAVHITVQ
jgi:hypothetical protein